MVSIPVLTSNQVRKVIVEQSKRANVGHIGSALSIVDILVALLPGLKNFGQKDTADRDRFILSNGHTSLALYAVLYSLGIISQEDLNSYCADDSYLGVHPEFAINGVDFSTGSLGQGLSFGAGCALAARLQKSDQKVFVLLSDAECDEGSVWEAVMFASHRHLSNLVVIIDLNGQQAMGYTDDVLNLSPMADKWDAFKWDVHEVNGNDVNKMRNVISSLNFAIGQPHVLIASTLFGKGVSFMEKQIKWHYLPLTDEEYQQALLEIG